VTRVLVVAASAVVRAGLESILRERTGIEVAGTTAGSLALADAVERTQPDVVLVELDRNQEPAPAILPVLAPGAGLPALVVLADDDAEGVASALRLGARAVLARDAQPAEITAAVEAAAAGLVVLDAAGAESLLAHLPALGRAVARPGAETLTPREIEVLGLLAEGEGNKQIARHLGISEHTVKFHVGSILAKLGAGSRTEAVTLGVRLGLIMV